LRTLLDLPTAPAPEMFSLPGLVAERLTPADRQHLRRIDRDPAVMASMGGVRSAAATDAYLERNLEHWVEYGFGIWMLRAPDSGELIGRAGLRHILVEQTDEIELAYALLPEWWGRGLGTTAARACVTIAREWIGLPSVVALVLPENHRSQRVLTKTALLHERDVIHAGRPHLLYRTD
jgi:ribosomal-protein-alanine N-acetyltransferase